MALNSRRVVDGKRTYAVHPLVLIGALSAFHMHYTRSKSFISNPIKIEPLI